MLFQECCAKAATGFDFAKFWSSFLGTAVPVFTAFGVIFYNNQRTTASLSRWIKLNHFDLFQDVADCARTYEEKQSFDIFGDRLKQQIDLMRDSLHSDSNAGLSTGDYQAVYRSVSTAEYLHWVYSHSFDRAPITAYINECLDALRKTQETFGSWPPTRQFAEVTYMNGTKRLA